MNKQKRLDLADRIQEYRNYIFHLTEVRMPIKFGDVDDFLRHIQRKLEE